MFLVRKVHAQLKWHQVGSRTIYPRSSQGINYGIFAALMSLGLNSSFQQKPFISKGEQRTGGKFREVCLTVIAAGNGVGVVSKVSKACHVSIGLKRNPGWTLKSLLIM